MLVRILSRMVIVCLLIVNRIGYAPASYGTLSSLDRKASLLSIAGHYVENTGNTTMRYLEIFRTGMLRVCEKFLSLSYQCTDRFQDVSLAQVRQASVVCACKLSQFFSG